MTTDEGYIYPESYEAVSNAAMTRGFWLSQAAHAVKYESIHGQPLGLTEEQLAQRRAILDIAHSVLVKASRRETKEGVAQWRAAEAASNG